MKVAISQPTYIPWLGYFDLIDQVDIFVFLDTVQFEKRSWQQRNRIKRPGGLSLLTVPAAVKGRFGQKIKNVEIKDSHFARKHLRAIEVNYRKAPALAAHFAEFSDIMKSFPAGSRLADLNMQLIRWSCRKLGIATQLVRASEIDHRGSRSELLLNLCRSLNAQTYLSTPGAAQYLLPDISRFSAAGIKVIFQQYDHPHYRQQFPTFLSHASAIDLLFNEGDCSLNILRSGRRPALPPEHLAITLEERLTGCRLAG